MDPQCASVESCHVPGAFNVHAMMLPFGTKAKMLVTSIITNNQRSIQWFELPL